MAGAASLVPALGIGSLPDAADLFWGGLSLLGLYGIVLSLRWMRDRASD